MGYRELDWLGTDYVVMDFETTGFSSRNDAIIQVGAVKYRDNVEVDVYNTNVAYDGEIPEIITEITGIVESDLEGAPELRVVLEGLLEFVDDNVLVAHNAKFDLGFLLDKMEETGLGYKDFEVVDTLRQARRFIRTPNHKLETLKDYLGLHQYQSHSALDDCYVTNGVYQYCQNKLGGKS